MVPWGPVGTLSGFRGEATDLAIKNNIFHVLIETQHSPAIVLGG